MHKPKTGIVLFVALVLVSSIAGQVAMADAHSLPPLVIMLVDRQAVTESEEGSDIVKSTLGLVSTLRSEGLFAFVSLDDPQKVLGPLTTNDPGFDAFQEQVQTKLLEPVSVQNPDPGPAIGDVYNFLSSERAPVGSTIYFLTGGEFEQDAEGLVDRFMTIAPRFQEQEWTIVGLTLPGTSPNVSKFVEEISVASGGESIELSTPSTFMALAANILHANRQVVLDDLGQDELSSTDIFTAAFDIVPGTKETTVLFFKEGDFGTLRLSNPSGLEALSGDRAQTVVVDTPHVVVWKLTDPEPGGWRVDARGVRGVVSAWTFSENKFNISLETPGPVPLGQSATLVARVTDGRHNVSPDGVLVIAKLITPDGSTIVHELNDDGSSGDALAGDGYFSATIPPLAVEGEYKVELGLSWPEFDHRISSRSEFTAQVFPSIQVIQMQTDGLRPGERVQIATIRVLVNGHPYAVPTEDVTFTAVSNEGDAGPVEIKPRELVNQGQAWQYDVFLTSLNESLHTISFGLNTEYSGKAFTFGTDSLVISSVPPPVPAQTLVIAVPTSPPPAQPVVQAPPVIQPPGFLWWVLTFPAILLVGLMVWGVYWVTRTRPYGYLFSDSNQMMVDFSKLKRSTLTSLFSRSSVRGKELNVPGLEGVSFDFRGKGITLNTQHVTPTIRVNDQPIIEQVSIHDKTWIGTHGRLFTFLLSPLMQPEPGMAGADDD